MRRHRRVSQVPQTCRFQQEPNAGQREERKTEPAERRVRWSRKIVGKNGTGRRCHRQCQSDAEECRRQREIDGRATEGPKRSMRRHIDHHRGEHGSTAARHRPDSEDTLDGFDVSQLESGREKVGEHIERREHGEKGQAEDLPAQPRRAPSLPGFPRSFRSPQMENRRRHAQDSQQEAGDPMNCMSCHVHVGWCRLDVPVPNILESECADRHLSQHEHHGERPVASLGPHGEVIYGKRVGWPFLGASVAGRGERVFRVGSGREEAA